MKNKILNSTKGFTFVELIISITIIAILSVLGFVSYSKNLEDSRDSQRKSELSGVAAGLKQQKIKRGEYPDPGSNYNITNSGYLVAIQGKLDENIIISTIDKIPLDPFVNVPYTFSISKNKQEFQLAATLENNGVNKSLLLGDYKSVSRNILPTITLAISSSTDIEINSLIGSGLVNRTKFIFDGSIHNLPYTFNSPFLPYSDNTTFSGLIDDININWWQNSDYRSCVEISDDGKFIGNGEYQINSSGTLINTGCTN
ncbi:MAG: prepilin-type N-terminal cleavage/methylation domain-containing protein [Candidatus Gracilibacteria bacterium]